MLLFSHFTFGKLITKTEEMGTCQVHVPPVLQSNAQQLKQGRRMHCILHATCNQVQLVLMRCLDDNPRGLKRNDGESFNQTVQTFLVSLGLVRSEKLEHRPSQRLRL